MCFATQGISHINLRYVYIIFKEKPSLGVVPRYIKDMSRATGGSTRCSCSFPSFPPSSSSSSRPSSWASRPSSWLSGLSSWLSGLSSWSSLLSSWLSRGVARLRAPPRSPARPRRRLAHPPAPPRCSPVPAPPHCSPLPAPPRCPPPRCSPLLAPPRCFARHYRYCRCC